MPWRRELRKIERKLATARKAATEQATDDIVQPLKEKMAKFAKELPNHLQEQWKGAVKISTDFIAEATEDKKQEILELLKDRWTKVVESSEESDQDSSRDKRSSLESQKNPPSSPETVATANGNENNIQQPIASPQSTKLSEQEKITSEEICVTPISTGNEECKIEAEPANTPNEDNMTDELTDFLNSFDNSHFMGASDSVELTDYINPATEKMDSVRVMDALRQAIDNYIRMDEYQRLVYDECTHKFGQCANQIIVKLESKCEDAMVRMRHLTVFKQIVGKAIAVQEKYFDSVRRNLEMVYLLLEAVEQSASFGVEENLDKSKMSRQATDCLDNSFSQLVSLAKYTVEINNWLSQYEAFLEEQITAIQSNRNLEQKEPNPVKMVLNSVVLMKV